MRSLVISLIILIFLLKIASADVLQSGQTTFEILGIVLSPLCSSDDDFTGTCQNLALYGDLLYLNVRWAADYSDGIDRYIGTECYLNCPYVGRYIDTGCLAYKNSTNYCNYTAMTGHGFCTIVNPNYLFKNQLNNVTCKFYNPSNLYINYLPYPNRTFYPTNFQVFTTQNESITVGQPFILGLNIRSMGLIFTNYTANVSVFPNQQSVILATIENPVSNTNQLKYNEIGKLNPKITFLSAGTKNFRVLTKSNVTIGCDKCGPEDICIDDGCWKESIVSITARISSLPDFGLIGLIQIMILSVLVILIVGSRPKIE